VKEGRFASLISETVGRVSGLLKNANILFMIRPTGKKDAQERAPLQAVRLSDMAQPRTSAPTPAEEDLPHPPDRKGRSSSQKKPKAERGNNGDRRRTGPKVPRKMTAVRIHNIAEHYVANREASTAMLREVLMRRLWRRCASLGSEEAQAERAEAESLIETEIEKLVKAGFVDDARFAETKARGWLAAGRGARRIIMDLAQKGISKDMAEDALTEAARETTGILMQDIPQEEILRSAEDEAADVFARKKRLGRYRTKPMPEDRLEAAKVWRREAAAMARAGFSMDLITQTLEQPPEEDFP
jgi:regulatory protein